MHGMIGPVWHGTRAKFKKFKLQPGAHLGFHFSKSQETSASFGPEKAYFLDIKHPLKTRDIEAWGSAYTVVQEFGTQIFPEGWHRSEFEQQAALEEAYENGQKVNIDKLGSLREGLLEAVRKQIQAKGYDGIQYENTIEGGGTSYIVFNPKQIYPARTEANCDAIQSPLQRSTSECS